jgi:hypothetical protein
VPPRAPKTREHLRCPLCGKVSRGPSFGAAGRHALQQLTQHFVGGATGLRWTRGPMPVETASYLLSTVLPLVTEQLTDYLEAYTHKVALVEAALRARLHGAAVRPPLWSYSTRPTLSATILHPTLKEE